MSNIIILHGIILILLFTLSFVACVVIPHIIELKRSTKCPKCGAELIGGK